MGSPRIWTTWRKLPGNVLPALCGAPFGAAGIAWLAWRVPPWPGVALLALWPLASAVALNWLGLFGNADLRRRLAARLEPSAGAIFVGAARRGYVDLLDPHETLGFLSLDAGRLALRTESFRLDLAKRDVRGVGRAPNPHSLFGFGGWIVIAHAGGDIRIEPRECASLLENRRYAETLRARLRAWLAA